MDGADLPMDGRLDEPLEGGRTVGYRARRRAPVVDYSAVGAHDPGEYWKEVPAVRSAVLKPNDLYILHSVETVNVPPTHVASMTACDAARGEFRAHFAGFFDPGFGADGDSRAVLEVKCRDSRFLLTHGQPVATMVYEWLVERPERLYGEAIGSHYQGQKLRLGKHFGEAE